MPGDRRADLAKIASAAGASAARIARAAEVEAATGFEPGAVAPFPLPKVVERVFVDRTLLTHDLVWVGAGSPAHLAAIRPAELLRLARAEPMDAVQEAAYDYPPAVRRERRRLMRETETIWMNGEFIPWKDATIHVGAHGLHYGTGVFEGIRCYETPKGPAVFRLAEHLNRLESSARLLYMELPYGVDEIRTAMHELIGAERPRRVLRAAVRLLRLRRARRPHGRQPGRGRDHELALGQLPRGRERGLAGSAPRSPPGSGSARTRSRTSRRRPGST